MVATVTRFRIQDADTLLLQSLATLTLGQKGIERIYIIGT